MAWLWLFIAGLLEIAWAIGLKYTHAFTRLWPSVVTVLLMIASFVLLARAVRDLPVGTAYAVWTGIGAAGTFLIGIWFFGDPSSLGRYLGVVLIIMGMVTVKLAH